MSTWDRLSLGATPVNRMARNVAKRHHRDDDPPLPTADDGRLLRAQQEAQYWEAMYDDLLERHATTVEMFTDMLKLFSATKHNDAFRPRRDSGVEPATEG